MKLEYDQIRPNLKSHGFPIYIDVHRIFKKRGGADVFILEKQKQSRQVLTHFGRGGRFS